MSSKVVAEGEQEKGPTPERLAYWAEMKKERTAQKSRKRELKNVIREARDASNDAAFTLYSIKFMRQLKDSGDTFSETCGCADTAALRKMGKEQLATVIETFLMCEDYIFQELRSGAEGEII